MTAEVGRRASNHYWGVPSETKWCSLAGKKHQRWKMDESPLGESSKVLVSQ